MNVVLSLMGETNELLKKFLLEAVVPPTVMICLSSVFSGEECCKMLGLGIHKFLASLCFPKRRPSS